MRIYAENPIRWVPQLLVDLIVLVWIAAWIGMAGQVREAILGWKTSGRQMVHAGGELENTFVDASRTADGVPFVGDDLSKVLGRGTVAGDVLADVGRREIEAVGYAANGVAVVLVVVALIPVLAGWFPRRVRYARAAGRAVAMRSEAGDLLALHALSTLPYRRLKKITPDPASAWRRGDAEVIDRLANTQLRKLGLRPLRRTAVAATGPASALDGSTQRTEE